MPPKSHPVPAEFTDASRGDRLHKVLARCGVASRRDCEQLIKEGRVQVNGQVVRGVPAWVDPAHDRVSVDGEVVRAPREARGPSRAPPLTYVLVNKPKRVISTTSDPEGRTHVLDLLPSELTRSLRLFPVGRLDADSTGLMLLTNDGELANRLTHPRYEAAKQYCVSVRGRLSDDDLERLQEGLHLADRTSVPDEGGRSRRARMTTVQRLGTHQDRTRGDQTQLVVTLHEGRNRQIRRMLARLGHKVRRLERIAIGPLRLKGLAAGEWRRLRPPEIWRLKAAAGLRGGRTREDPGGQSRVEKGRRDQGTKGPARP